MDVSIGNGNPSMEDVHLGQGLSEGQSGVRLSRRQKRKLRKRRGVEGLENSHTGGGDKMGLKDSSSMRDAPGGHLGSVVKLSSESGWKEDESDGVLSRPKKERMRKRRNREKNRFNALGNSDVCTKMDDRLAVSLSQEICQGKEGNSMDNASNGLNSSIDGQMADGREFRKEDLNSVKQAVELKNVKESSLISKKESDSWRSKCTTVLKMRDLLTFKRHDRKRRKCSSGINSEPIKEDNMKQTSFDHKEKKHKDGFSENHLTVTEEKHVASKQVVEETSAQNLAHLSALKEYRKRMKRKLKEASRGNSLTKGVSQTASKKSLEKVYHPNRKLLVLDLNGILVDVVNGGKKPDIRVSAKSVYKRPFCNDFLSFCFERFNVGVWSSRCEYALHRKNVTKLVNFIFAESKQNLLFCWNQKHCTETRFKTIDKPRKPLVLKELKKLWEKWNPNFPWEMGECNESNTLLLDDSPYKALCNPAHTAIFPYPYDHNNVEDFSLGPGGDIRIYLKGIAAAENVQNYVKQNPFGQPAITESDPSWHFYLKVIGTTQSKGHHKFDTSDPLTMEV